MARSEIDLVILHPTTGEYVENAEIDVELRPSGTAAIVYAGETGGSTNSQPLLSDEQGRVQGWLERGRYQAVITVSGFPVTTEYLDIAPGEDGAVTTTWINDEAVTTAKIGPDAVTGAKIADDAVDTEHLADDSVTGAQIETGAVGSTEIGADQVTATQLRDDTSTDSNRAVTSDHIRDSAVTTAKINNSAVTTAKIADLNVTEGKIADNAVTPDKVNLSYANNQQSGTIDGSQSASYLAATTLSTGLWLVIAGCAFNIDQTVNGHAIAAVGVANGWPTPTNYYKIWNLQGFARTSSPVTDDCQTAATHSFGVTISGSVVVGMAYTGNGTGSTSTFLGDGFITAVRIQ